MPPAALLEQPQPLPAGICSSTQRRTLTQTFFVTFLGTRTTYYSVFVSETLSLQHTL